MSEQILYASDVNIKTATIEVKVMKIGNRQVTLAVFRQIPEGQIIDHLTGKIRGIPWGKVNYHVGCNNLDLSPHLHICWQLDNNLYRAIVRDYTFRKGVSLNNHEYHTEEELRDISKNWRQSYAQLEQLDQLFIAV